MVTDQQVRRLLKLNQTEKTKAIAASKAGMSEKTARKYQKSGRLPSQMVKARNWRTRKNPFKEHWKEVTKILKVDATLEAKTIFDYLCRKYPDDYQEGQLRTLQRHIKKWKVREGQPKEVIFAQIHHPGDQAQSDFTSMNDMGVTINSQPFPHLLYHFVLTYSNWEWVSICQSESFEALSMGVQNALWQLGGVPKKHKTDNLSAAVKDLKGRKEFTDNYDALMAHYGLKKLKNNPGKANENGDVEQSHHQLMRSLKVEFLLRGHRDFESLDSYREFLEKAIHRRNRARSKRCSEELRVMRELPERRLDDYIVEEARVSKYSTIQVRRNTYSVDSRLIGEQLRIRVYGDRLQLWQAGAMLGDLPRLRGRGKACVNYRHIIDSLVKKPGAFRNYKYQSSLFPSLVFRSTYDWLSQQKPHRSDREYVQILHLAAMRGERRVEMICRDLLYSGESITAKSVETMLGKGRNTPTATVMDVPLKPYDYLLGGVFND